MGGVYQGLGGGAMPPWAKIIFIFDFYNEIEAIKTRTSMSLDNVSKQLYNFLMSSLVTILYTKIIEVGSFFTELLKNKNVDVFWDTL